MNSRLCFYVILFAVVLAKAEIRYIGNQRQLFVDDYVVGGLEGTHLNLHNPVNCGTVFKTGDTDAEDAHSGQYATVIFDEAANKYMMYYRGLYTQTTDGFGTYCYAESKDGINWVKPNLGLFEINGSKDNNAFLAGPEGTHSFSPFLDANPDAKKEQRFKATGLKRRSDNKQWLLMAYASPDGLHWEKMQEKEVLTSEGGLDSQNVAFWSDAENCYVCYYRAKIVDPANKYCLGGYRRVARATSKDFINWTPGVPMEYTTYGKPSIMEILYTNQTQPYFRAPQIYIGTAARLFQARKAVVEELMDENEIQRLSGGKNTEGGFYDKDSVKSAFRDCSDAVLISTRPGSNVYSRNFMEALIYPDLGIEHWVTRTTYPGYGIIQTSPTEMSFFAVCGQGLSTSRLVRYSMRLDGFVSVTAPYSGGVFYTEYLIFNGSELEINYQTSAGGFIKVELQDRVSVPIEKYSIDDSQEIVGNHISRIVKWKDTSDVSEFAGRTVRLKFVMKDAHLYSFKFN